MLNQRRTLKDSQGRQRVTGERLMEEGKRIREEKKADERRRTQVKEEQDS